MPDTIHIAASCDDNYAQHVGVVFQSLLDNTADPSGIELYLISNDISDLNQAKLTRLASKHGSQLRIIPADTSKYADLPTSRYGAAAYQRISLAHYLPREVDKVIYLDSDIIVLDDIRHLWEFPLAGNPLGAVENLSPKAHKHLDFSRNEYFNSGILVIDLEQWRDHDVHRQAVGIIINNAEKLHYFDQCSLNMVFRHRWKRLPLKWNQQADIYGVSKKYADGCSYSKTELTEAILEPSIVHFIGTQKPWLLNCFHPFKKTYQQYLNKTTWKGTQPNDKSLLNTIKYSLKIRQRYKQWQRIKAIARHSIGH